MIGWVSLPAIPSPTASPLTSASCSASSSSACSQPSAQWGLQRCTLSSEGHRGTEERAPAFRARRPRQARPETQGPILTLPDPVCDSLLLSGASGSCPWDQFVNLPRGSAPVLAQKRKQRLCPLEHPRAAFLPLLRAPFWPFQPSSTPGLLTSPTQCSRSGTPKTWPGRRAAQDLPFRASPFPSPASQKANGAHGRRFSQVSLTQSLQLVRTALGHLSKLLVLDGQGSPAHLQAGPQCQVLLG